MSVFADARDAIAATLTTAGITVTLDPAAAPPFVLVDLPDDIRPQAGTRHWECVVPVWIVAVSPLTRDNAGDLLDRLEEVMAAVQRPTAGLDTYDRAGGRTPGYRVDVPYGIPRPT